MAPTANAPTITVIADGQPVEGVVRRAFGRGDVEHNKGKRESEDKLGDERCRNIRNLHRSAALAARKMATKAATTRPRPARSNKGSHRGLGICLGGNGERDGRVEMSPEMCPVAKTMTMSEAPIASGAITPAAPG